MVPGTNFNNKVFSLAARKLKNEFSWSSTRHVIFTECRRKYYYHYYGSWGGWEKSSDDLSKELYVLKGLVNRHGWVGALVNREIKRVLNELRSTGKVKPLAVSISRLSRYMRTEWRLSKSLKCRGKSKSTLLYEHEYGVEVEQERWREAHERAMTCIRNFHSSRTLGYLMSSRDYEILVIEKEKPVFFPIKGTKVYVNVPFAFKRSGGKTVIVEWNTGENSPEPLKSLCRVIYMGEKYDLDPHNISIRECKLLYNTEEELTFDLRELQAAREEIEASIQEMKVLLSEEETNTASIENFPKTDDLSMCERCNFYKSCSKT
ncbi:MAG: hypothetical protein V3U74_06865 [Thermodesulfobacteriota bacterium]